MQEALDKLGINLNVTFSLVFLLLIWVRVLAMMSVVPFLFGKPVPRYVVVGCAMAFAIYAYPNLIPKGPHELPAEKLALILLFLKEIFYGLVIGIAVSIIFHAFSAVGQMIDNQRGMSIARILIPQLGEQSSMSGIFLYQFGVVLYLAMGGHLVFLDGFFRSFVDLPVLGFPVAGPGLYPMVDLFMRITGDVIFISIQMAAPVIIAIFMADIILGIANRVAPQINVWELGFQVKGYVGILLLFVSLTMIGNQIFNYSMKANSYAVQVTDLLKGKVPEGAPASPTEPVEPEGPEVKELPKVKTIE